jgi:hypothetical protein
VLISLRVELDDPFSAAAVTAAVTELSGAASSPGGGKHFEHGGLCRKWEWQSAPRLHLSGIHRGDRGGGERCMCVRGEEAQERVEVEVHVRA